MRGDEGSCEGGSGVGEAEKGDKGGKHGGQQQEQKREEGKMKEEGGTEADGCGRWKEAGRLGFYRSSTVYEIRRYVSSAEESSLHLRRCILPLPLCALLTRKLHCR
jgi:hypothetical protein